MASLVFDDFFGFLAKLSKFFCVKVEGGGWSYISSAAYTNNKMKKDNFKQCSQNHYYKVIIITK